MSVEAWTFVVNTANFVIGSLGGREGKDKESWDSCTIREWYPSLAINHQAKFSKLLSESCYRR